MDGSMDGWLVGKMRDGYIVKETEWRVRERGIKSERCCKSTGKKLLKPTMALLISKP